MKKRSTILFAVLFALANLSQAQRKSIPLYKGVAPGSESWNWAEKEFFDHNSNLVYDVSQPSMEVFFPPDSIANGTSIIICPGGGFLLLEIENEGWNIAESLNKKGITAFVLKYRLMKSKTDNPQEEMFAKAMDISQLAIDADTVIRFAVADLSTAMLEIRTNAVKYKIDPDKIGIIGFSAGGTLATAMAYNYNATTRPAFVATIYPWITPVIGKMVPNDAPPLFIAAASDDQLGFHVGSVDLYLDWVKSRRSAELHLYSTGGHGFVAFKSGLSVDGWMDLFTDWLREKEFIKTP